MNEFTSLDDIVRAAVFVGLRVSGLMLFAPGLSNSAVPARVKASFVAVMVLLLWPVVQKAPMQIAIHASLTTWIGVAANEMFIGIIVGLVMNFIFDAAQFAGQIAGMQMGFAMATMMDPNSQADSPVLSIFHQMIVMLIFFALDVPHWILRALVNSFYYLPAGESVLTNARIEGLVHTAGAIWVLGLQIAAPTLIATVVADFVLAFIGKASPQMPIFMVGISVKAVLGMLVLITVLTSWPRYFAVRFTEAMGWCEGLLHLTAR